jgi:hypothetical protein
MTRDQVKPNLRVRVKQTPPPFTLCGAILDDGCDSRLVGPGDVLTLTGQFAYRSLSGRECPYFRRVDGKTNYIELDALELIEDGGAPVFLFVWA